MGRNADSRTKSVLRANRLNSPKLSYGLQRAYAWPDESIPLRPARPVSCVYSPAVRVTWPSPRKRLSCSMTTDFAGRLTPIASVSVAKTTLSNPAAKQSSTASLNGVTMPAWCDARPAQRPVSHESKFSKARSSLDNSLTCSSTIVSTLRFSRPSRKSTPFSKAFWTASSQPCRENMKNIAGKRSAASKWEITSILRGRPTAPALLLGPRCFWPRILAKYLSTS